MSFPFCGDQIDMLSVYYNLEGYGESHVYKAILMGAQYQHLEWKTI